VGHNWIWLVQPPHHGAVADARQLDEAVHRVKLAVRPPLRDDLPRVRRAPQGGLSLPGCQIGYMLVAPRCQIGYMEHAGCHQPVFWLQNNVKSANPTHRMRTGTSGEITGSSSSGRGPPLYEMKSRNTSAA
jgi:hypothetical protein